MSFYLACVVAAELMMRHPSHKLLLPETQGRHTALFLTAKMKAKVKLKNSLKTYFEAKSANLIYCT